MPAATNTSNIDRAGLWGPMPPVPADCDHATWLAMPSEERAEHIRRHAETQRDDYRGLGLSEADIEIRLEHAIEYWDRLARLVAMPSEERAERLRRAVEADRPHHLQGGLSEADLARRTAALIERWEDTAAAVRQRRAAGEQVR